MNDDASVFNDLKQKEWVSTPSAIKVAEQFQKVIEQSLPETFGYFGLALGKSTVKLDLSCSPIKHWFRISRHGDADLHADYSALPIASDSVDCLIMPHVLEFHHDPHQVLREIERVMIPEGRLFISGINPLSFYGSKYYTCRLFRKQCYEKRLIGLSRLKDWLLLMGFSLENYASLESVSSTKKSPYRPWVSRIASHFCNHYFIMARKQVSTMTPLRPSWRDNRKLVGARFAEPSVRSLVDQEIKKAQR